MDFRQRGGRCHTITKACPPGAQLWPGQVQEEGTCLMSRTLTAVDQRFRSQNPFHAILEPIQLTVIVIYLDLISSPIATSASTDTAWFSRCKAISRNRRWRRLELMGAESGGRLRRRWRHAGQRRVTGQVVEAGCVVGSGVGGLVVAIPKTYAPSLRGSAAAGGDARSRRLSGQRRCFSWGCDAMIIHWWLQQFRSGRRCVKPKL